MASNGVANAHPEVLGIIDTTKSYLYEELWKLCAGPLADLPKLGEKVYYFPQGHIEQIEVSTNEDMNHMKKIFDLPSKLRCHVTGFQLEVEKDTDETFVHMTLIPDTMQIAIPIPNGNHRRPIVRSFTKILTASDTSVHGGFSVLRKHAIECLPPLDLSQPTPTQEIIAKDLHGNEWRFKHIFRGTPQRHLFTTGWSAFTTAKKLVAGDSFILVRGENGEIQIGIRRAMHKQGNNASSIISTETMHHGVIASAVDAINTHCAFTVVYKPRLSQFVISYEKFLEAVNNKFCLGSTFKMQFEGEDFIERICHGKIVGVKDFSPQWKNSDWRRLEVQWDDSASIQRPNKVSEWEIEHSLPSSNPFQSASLKNKRFRQVCEIDSTSSNLWVPTLTQGQEIGQSSMNYPISVAQTSYHNAIQDSNIPSDWLMSNSLIPTMSKPNDNDQTIHSTKEKILTNSTTSCILFGVNLTTPRKTKDHLGLIDSYQNSYISKLSEEKTLDQNQTLASSKEVQRPHINSKRSRTKVQMQGVGVGRAVDLTVLNGYNQLIDELEKLFDLKGELHTRNQWEIVFTDNEGDMMLVGDDPWSEFCNMVKKIYICLKENVEKMKSAKNFSEGGKMIDKVYK